MEKRISDNIKIFGFIMTCFMVFYHIGDLEMDKASNIVDLTINSELNYIFKAMGGVVMSHFFAVTGFLLFYGLSYVNYKKKIQRRFFSLLIPYVMWQAIIAIKYMIQWHSLITLKQFLIKTFGFVAFPIDGAMWYVYAIFVLALFSPIMFFLFHDKKIGWITVIFLMVFFRIIGNA